MEDHIDEIRLKQVVNTLRNVQQISTIDRYFRRFEFLRIRVLRLCPWFPPGYFVATFIRGLHDEFQYYVLQFNPTTVVDAYDLACKYEYSTKASQHDESRVNHSAKDIVDLVQSVDADSIDNIVAEVIPEITPSLLLDDVGCEAATFPSTIELGTCLSVELILVDPVLRTTAKIENVFDGGLTLHSMVTPLGSSIYNRHLRLVSKDPSGAMIDLAGHSQWQGSSCDRKLLWPEIVGRQECRQLMWSWTSSQLARQSNIGFDPGIFALLVQSSYSLCTHKETFAGTTIRATTAYGNDASTLCTTVWCDNSHEPAVILQTLQFTHEPANYSLCAEFPLEEFDSRRRSIELQEKLDDRIPLNLMNAKRGHHKHPELKSDGIPLCVLHPYQQQALYRMPELEKGVDVEQAAVHINKVSGEATTKFPSAVKMTNGGILANARSLEKTVLPITLILARPGKEVPDYEKVIKDCNEDASELRKQNERHLPIETMQIDKGGTLIVCPMALLGQWKDGLDTHGTPGSLQVFVQYGTRLLLYPRIFSSLFLLSNALLKGIARSPATYHFSITGSGLFGTTVQKEVTAMSQPRSFRPDIDVIQAVLLPQMTWRRQEKSEMVGQWKTKLDDIDNVVVSVKARSIPGVLTDDEFFSSCNETNTVSDCVDFLPADERRQLEVELKMAGSDDATDSGPSIDFITHMHSFYKQEDTHIEDMPSCRTCEDQPKMVSGLWRTSLARTNRLCILLLLTKPCSSSLDISLYHPTCNLQWQWTSCDIASDCSGLVASLGHILPHSATDLLTRSSRLDIPTTVILRLIILVV